MMFRVLKEFENLKKIYVAGGMMDFKGWMVIDHDKEQLHATR